MNKYEKQGEHESLPVNNTEEKMREYIFDIQHFAEIAPLTTTTKMSPTWKTFYNKTLLENSRETMVFTQFGKKTPIHGGKCEWRRYNKFAKATTPLQEGVIPSAQEFGITKVEATVNQYGSFTAVTDRLKYEAFDNVIYGAVEEMGVTQGETYDVLTRNAIIGGNSVLYCPNGNTEIDDRADITNACVLTPEIVAKAATWLKKNKAPTIDGSYVALIHPSVAFDLRNSDEWKAFHQYAAPEPIFKGEIGMLHGVRFIESSACKVWKGPTGSAKYATLFLGKDAYGIVEPEGEGMQMYVKDASEIGGPIEQFSTIGFKFCHSAQILYQERLLRVESGSSLGDMDEEN